MCQKTCAGTKKGLTPIRLENIAGQVMKQFKKLSLTKQKKLDQEWTMNGLKSSRKKLDYKNRKIANKVKLVQVNKKPQAKAIFCSNTVLLDRFHNAKPLAFSLHFLFRLDQNHHFNLASPKSSLQFGFKNV